MDRRPRFAVGTVGNLDAYPKLTLQAFTIGEGGPVFLRRAAFGDDAKPDRRSFRVVDGQLETHADDIARVLPDEIAEAIAALDSMIAEREASLRELREQRQCALNEGAERGEPIVIDDG